MRLATQITRLSNGLRVASKEAPGHFVSLGCFIDTGSRLETPETAGASYMIQSMAYKSTEGFTSDKLLNELESMGGQLQCQAAREHILYQATVFRRDMARAMNVLNEIVLKPLYLDAEVEEAKVSTSYELANNEFKHDVTIPEIVHATAFQSTRKPILDEKYPPETLGRPLVVQKSVLDDFHSHKIRDFRNLWYTPERMVVTGVGMPHNELVELAEKHFGHLKPADKSILARQALLQKPAVYTGGTTIIDTTGKPVSPNPDDMLLSHVHVGFEAFGASDPDIYALATLTTLLGGGGSFSSGGPGKGTASH
jgi:processing peptidase subunit alpha